MISIQFSVYSFEHYFRALFQYSFNIFTDIFTDVQGGGGGGPAGCPGGGGDYCSALATSPSTTKQAYELMRLCWGRRAVNRPPFIMIQKALCSQLHQSSQSVE